MEMDTINIVELIEKNPITKLSKDYNVKLLTKIKEQFTDFEQQLFLSSFYCYLNCHPKNDFVIDLDNVWKWIGFSQKVKAKVLLENNFIEEKDYVKSLSHAVKQTPHTKGGQNREIFMLNIETFKKFCLKAGTKKADEIHDYYMKLEEIIHIVIQEECNELKLLLDQKNKELEDEKSQTEKEKEELKEKTLLEQFPNNTQCIYIGLIDNKTLGKPNSKMYQETVIKFGQSNNLNERVKAHKKTYENFRLYNAYKVKNKIEIENCIKKHPTLKNRLRIVTIDDIAHRELIALDNEEFTIDKVEQLIKDIIKENEYNIENYNLLLKKNDELQNEIYRLKDEIKEQNKILENSNKKIQKLEYDVTEEIKTKIASNYAICKYGYFIYAYQYENMRFVCSITRQKDYDTVFKNLKDLYPSGEMICQLKCSYPLTEKNMTFILKQNCVSLGQNKFECSVDTIKKILDVSVKLEELLMEQSKDIDSLHSFLENKKINLNDNDADPEVPVVRKAKRSIDKINKDTGEVVATYESIEAAGRSCGLTTGAAIGYALRESRLCQGFLWRYSGVSKEEQFAEQPVIKICCKNGEKMCFKNIADAAKDANISAPALRRRILTDVHINNYHWVFDKNACHYN
jgi:flagellar motility protein MotE (MotC chaperone)